MSCSVHQQRYQQCFFAVRVAHHIAISGVAVHLKNNTTNALAALLIRSTTAVCNNILHRTCRILCFLPYTMRSMMLLSLRFAHIAWESMFQIFFSIARLKGSRFIVNLRYPMMSAWASSRIRAKCTSICSLPLRETGRQL